MVRAAAAVMATLGLLGVGLAAAASELGVDVASWQHPDGSSIDWPAVKADGVSFAFVKATEGVSYTNPYFAADWAASADAGLFRGAYHFARPSAGSAAAQARYFVSEAGLADRPGDLPPVLDLEVTGGLGVTALRAWTANWLQTVESLTGRTPVIYTSPYFWERSMGDSPAFARYPLWIANYYVTQPRVPGGWSTWSFWQGRSDGRVRGIRGDVDMNAFNGTPAELAALANAAPGTGPAPAPEDPPTARTTATVTMTPSRAAVYAGQRVTLSGHLTTDAGAPLAGRPVVLRTRPAGESTWVRVAAASTDEGGGFAIPVTVSSGAGYRVTAPAAQDTTRAVSGVAAVSVIPKAVARLELRAGRASVTVGTRVRLFGHLAAGDGTPAPGSTVRYFVRPAGAATWTLLGSATTDAATGWHEQSVRPRQTSTYKAVFPGSRRLMRARSDLVTVTVP